MLQSLGIGLTDLPTAGSESESRHGSSPCFAMLSPFEVTVGGKKICGSAQFRSGGLFLQHGSLRVRDNWDASDLTSIWPSGYALDDDRVTCVDLETKEITEFARIEGRFVEFFAFRFGTRIIRI
jgi:lipoate-protein ligase A